MNTFVPPRRQGNRRLKKRKLKTAPAAMSMPAPESTALSTPQGSPSAEWLATPFKPVEPSYGEPGSDEGIDLRGYWRVLAKRKWTVLTFFSITMAVTATGPS